MMTDPIADMLTRIRNASAVGKTEVVLPYSKLKFEIAKLLEREGYIKGVEKTKNKFDEILIKLRYHKNKKSYISQIKRISKPGRRVYAGKDELPIVLDNIGIAIISTSKGIITNKEAKKKKLGGEIICEIY